MTDKQIIKPRPICLYEDTCLHLKEKTRLCKDCVHHKNYWSELLEKEQLEKIKSLEQECEELKEAIDGLLKIQYQLADSCNKYVQTLAEIKEIAETISLPMGTGKSCNRVILAKQIIQKISECEGNNDMENN